MHIGLVGLGKMGLNLALNLQEHGHIVTAYDAFPGAQQAYIEQGGQVVASLEALVQSLPTPRVLWLMVPAGDPVDQVLDTLFPLLAPQDIVIDGGNSHYKDSIRRAQALHTNELHYIDVGTSGGMEGARLGACYMIGGDETIFSSIEPLFRDSSVDGGYLYTGPVGSGHYAKMVHNGIEYGMMAAIGEGFEILSKSPYAFDYAKLADVWSHGSVIRGWLMELTAEAFHADPQLTKLKSVIGSSGEGKWTVEEALALGVSSPITALALFARYQSQETDHFSGKVVSALRKGFGGHAVTESSEASEDSSN
ncbi:MAG: decarboxylating 6-phosphogluconate dehydrogenase [Acidibacillus sp.]|uniref:6-phosphogluconate dehydrogenase, NAD(+)-dependent, decarboxylating n=1 Tax=Sulfoacidibacillus ferrooxidans TaxID=2005001 RepID=A0A9X2AEN0_9BACL|nr:decarboxylating 6-phosphogluconate dehydrogenase [Sulfoacidibacillus ferrooxidans]MCI0183507.1 6-phosphogluconate dehydrogenase, NAD(+)-dependent, decarboxylating [Sulfoacidibacillus ferrooxidans]MCY0891993.1 decarboxylating 6-phosphogluconate dehydrogenase [Acidibacillus sp.]